MFCIEASHHPDPTNAEVDDQVETLEQVYALYDKYKDVYKNIWISEEGHREDNGQYGWFYYWWSDSQVENYGNERNRKIGWLHDGPLTYQLPYIPLVV